MRALAWLPLIAQVGWLAYGVWLWATNIRTCSADCEYNVLAYMYWGAVETLVLPLALLGAVVLLRSRR
jgi:hypothetical protein